MNTLIDKIINSVKMRDKDFYTREQVIKAIELFRVRETIVYPSIYHPDITINGFHISPQRGSLDSFDTSTYPIDSRASQMILYVLR